MDAGYKQVWDLCNKYTDMTKKSIYDDPISFAYKNTSKEQWHKLFADMRKAEWIDDDQIKKVNEGAESNDK